MGAEHYSLSSSARRVGHISAPVGAPGAPVSVVSARGAPGHSEAHPGCSRELWDHPGCSRELWSSSWALSVALELILGALGRPGTHPGRSRARGGSFAAPSVAGFRHMSALSAAGPAETAVNLPNDTLMGVACRHRRRYAVRRRRR